MSNRHLITGATGFVGGAIVLELLERTDLELVCLVRPGKKPVQERLIESLSVAARAYGREDLLGEIQHRCHAVAGDIVQPSCGQEASSLRDIAEVWHCAASLKFEDADAEEILLHNVTGTRNVRALAQVLGVSCFNHVSTAYVAGSRTGEVLETLPPEGVVTNNCYERSKVQAEREIHEASAMHTRIFRPSIVIGHSRTYAATSFTGLYGFIRGLQRFQGKVSDYLGGFLSHRQLRLRANPEARVNVIPVDAMAEEAVRIARSNSPHRFFHLVHANPDKVEPTLEMIFRKVGLLSPRYVESTKEFTSLDERLDRELSFYGSYLRHTKQFDRTHTESVTGQSVAAARQPLGVSQIEPYVDWYLRCLELDRRARSARRQEHGGSEAAVQLSS